MSLSAFFESDGGGGVSIDGLTSMANIMASLALLYAL